MADIKELQSDLQRLRAKYSERDGRMSRIRTVRRPGGLRELFPEMFPEDALYSEQMVANMVDIAARDIAEVLAPLPAFNCSSSLSVTDRARKFAEKRTKIVYNYVDASRLAIQMYNAADQFVSYGWAIGVVRLDFQRQVPIIQLIDPSGCYVRRDQWGRVTRLFQCMQVPAADALEQFPHLRRLLDRTQRRDGMVELVRVVDDSFEAMFCSEGEGELCAVAGNRIGEAAVHVFARPGLTDEEIGQFDDVIGVQLAKAMFGLLTLEAASKAVQAPIAAPNDVMELSVGPDAMLRSASPERIRRVELNVPSAAFVQQQALDAELRQGSRYPEVRGGNTDASVITGRGVQALMSGFDTQIKTGNAIFAEGLGRLIGYCLQLDEKVWPELKRTVRGNANGTPYEIEYTPAKDIKGDYTVDVQYGLMAGLNPNQALVFALQALGAGLMSKDMARRNMPMAIDATAEEQKIEIENLRGSLLQAVAAYAQAIPALAQQGQSPSEPLERLVSVIQSRQKGVALEEAVSKAFAPPEPTPEELAMQEAMAGGGAGGGLPPGMDPSGLMQGVAPGQAGLPPGGGPDVMTLLAGLNPRGGPAMNAGVQRRIPI